MNTITHSENETQDLARTMAATLAPGDVLCLNGDLGAGKSTFARALIRALCGIPDLDVPSPTFTLVQNYDSPHGPVWHFDLYRIRNSDEIWELGWEDALAEGIVIVEWPERLGSLRPASAKTIYFKAMGPETREITVENGAIATIRNP